MQPLVYLARHGTTTLNRQNCYRGPLEIDLDDKGRRDAEELGAYFESLPILNQIVASSRNRTMETAQAIADRKPGMDIHPNRDLNAWNLGHLAGKEKTAETTKEVDYFVENPNESIQGGESLNDFSARIRPILAGACELAETCGAPMLLVVHSSVIHEAGKSVNGDHTSMLVKPGGVAAICCDGTARAIFKPDAAGMRKDRADNVT